MEGVYEHLATKSDIFDLKSDLLAEIARTETRLTSQIASVETRLIRWTVGLVLGGMTAICALTIVIAKFVT